MTSKRGGHFAHRCVDCRPGGRRGDTERVEVRWQSLVAFMKALDHLHQSMRSILHRRLFVYYGPPPMTRDAVSDTTIVAGGRARIRLNIEVNINYLITTLIK